jgi:predicted nucleotidyltransferase component of viral defense system
MYNSQSINERLRNFAKENNISNVERARVILCLERVIARLMQDKYLFSKLIFGGGFVLYQVTDSLRFTTDVDAIISDQDKDKLIASVKEALKVDLDDGFWFGEVSISTLEISSGYGGLRFKIPYKAGLPHPNKSELSRLRRVQLDISTGVDLETFSKSSTINSTLDIYKNIEWNVYPLEFICAEKIHCLYSKGDLNTRGKDVYDLDMLLPKLDINELNHALDQTFINRSDDIKQLKKVIKDINPDYLRENFQKIMPHFTGADFDNKWKSILKIINKL